MPRIFPEVCGYNTDLAESTLCGAIKTPADAWEHLRWQEMFVCGQVYQVSDVESANESLDM